MTAQQQLEDYLDGQLFHLRLTKDIHTKFLELLNAALKEAYDNGYDKGDTDGYDRGFDTGMEVNDDW